MILNFNPVQFLLNRLPAHKQQPNRLALFELPFRELLSAYDNYEDWRSNRLIEQNINHSTAVLEFWLNRQLGPGITIIENQVNVGFVEIANRDEATDFVEIANRDEAADFVEIANRDEPGIGIISTDFAVRAPYGTSNSEITNIIERYRAAGTTWEIINY